MSIASVTPSSHLILWCPLLHLPSVFLRSEIFPMNQLFESDDQNSGASASVLPMSIQGWFPLRLTGLISLLCKHLWGVFSSTTVQRHQFFGVLPSFQSSYHNHTWNTGKTIAMTIWTFVDRVVSLLLNILSRFVIAFMPKCNRLLISWLQSPSTVILEPKKREPATASTFSPFYLQSSNGAGCHDLSFFF